MRVLWQCPERALAGLVLAHGAGADMEHRHMQALAAAFGRSGIATLRFNFPFIDAGRRRPDPPAIAAATVAAAAAELAARSSLPLWLGGHSFGGRMASHAVLEHGIAARGLIFCAFPLHPPGKPGSARAAHLGRIGRPMLFLSGTRDPLAERALLEQVVSGLPAAELHWLEGADHGYRRPARARGESVFDEIAGAAREFVQRHA